MKSKKPMMIVGELLLNGLLVYFLIRILSLNRTDMIISTSVVQADRSILTYWCVWGTALVLGNLLLLLLWRRKKRVPVSAAPRVTFSPDKAQDPAAIRRELETFRVERPLLERYFHQGIEQLNSIDRKEERMSEILSRNELSLLSDASNALRDAEQTLCKKLVLVLNRAILCDPNETNLKRKEAVYRDNMRYMQAFLDENEDVLNRCEQLLSETVRYVEQKKTDQENVNLEVMTGVIRSLSNDGVRMSRQSDQ